MMKSSNNSNVFDPAKKHEIWQHSAITANSGMACQKYMTDHQGIIVLVTTWRHKHIVTDFTYLVTLVVPAELYAGL